MFSRREKTTKLPFVVLLLALGTFLMSTTEFVIAGLLPEMASDLGVGVPEAGMFMTAFAIGMIVGAPTISIATRPSAPLWFCRWWSSLSATWSPPSAPPSQSWLEPA